MRTISHILTIITVAIFLSGCSATWKMEREQQQAETRRIKERKALEAFAAVMARRYHEDYISLPEGDSVE